MLKKFFLKHSLEIAWISLLLTVCAAFFPSLFHIARSDQLNFLAEYAGRNDTFQILSDSLYYNRTRHFSVGDPLLFRPLLFLMLSAQQIAFKYNFFYWQMIALAAHLFVIWALLKLLRRWCNDAPLPQLSAWLTTIFFAFLFCNMEAVIWHGITPYVFFAGFVLMALERLDTFIDSRGLNRSALLACTAWMLAAVLTYEAGAWFILCFFAYAVLCLRGSGRARMALILLGPLVIYIGWSSGHWMLTHPPIDADTSRIIGGLPIVKTFFNLVFLVKSFILGGFLLHPTDVIEGQRLTLVSNTLAWSWPFNAWQIGRCIGAAVFLSVAGIIIAGIHVPRTRKDLGRIALIIAMIGGYLIILVVGRFNPRTREALIDGIYYFYIFWSLFVVLLFLITRPIIARMQRVNPAAWAYVILILMFAFAQALNIFSFTARMAQNAHQAKTFLQALDVFVDAHHNEPGFSFEFDPEDTYPINYPLTWGRTGDTPDTRYTITERLYPQFFNGSTPKYHLHSNTWIEHGYF